MKWISRGCALILCVSFLWVVLPVVFNGIGAFDLDYLFREPSLMGREGGIYPLLISTLWVNGIALALSVLVGLPAAFALALFFFKNRGLRLQPLTRLLLDLLSGTPSIVFGIFGNVFFCRYLGLGYSILAGALTLALMVLPTFVRLCEDAFLSLPKETWKVASSLGLGDRTFALKILVPATLPALTAALVLSWARAVAETAALLFTSGYSLREPNSIFDSGRTLSVHVFDLAMNVSGGDQMAYQAALLLLILSTSFGLTARIVVKVIQKVAGRKEATQ